ncbi:hypothetical protein ABZ379_46460, partial [Streptomyces canus]
MVSRSGPGRIAALVRWWPWGASPASYLLTVGAGDDGDDDGDDDDDVSPEKIQGILVTIAPVVGSARVVTAARRISETCGLPLLSGGGEEAIRPAVPRCVRRVPAGQGEDPPLNPAMPSRRPPG